MTHKLPRTRSAAE
jgi:hypothetical protein